MSFARSRAKIYADDDVKVRFARRRRRRRGRGRAEGDRRVPEEPEEVHEPRRPDSEGRAARRPAGHRQDAARARGRRRGEGAVLQPERIGVRRDVRRRRRGAHPRSVPAGRSQGAVHRLHRRARRARQGARRRARWAATRSASRRSISCSPRWTASTRARASSSWARPTGPRCSTRRCSAPAASIARCSSTSRTCKGREEILRIHAKDVKIARRRRPARSSRRAPPASPAPISPIWSTRRRCSRRATTRPAVDMKDFDEAIDRLIAGSRRSA